MISVANNFASSSGNDDFDWVTQIQQAAAHLIEDIEMHKLMEFYEDKLLPINIWLQHFVVLISIRLFRIK